MSNDIPHNFKQNTDFLYLSGLNQANSILLCETTTGAEVNSILFIRRQPDYLLQYEGEKLKSENVADIYGVSECYYLDEFGEQVEKRYVNPTKEGENRKLIFHLGSTSPNNFMSFSQHINPFITTLKTSKNSSKIEIKNLDSHIEKFRLIKSQNEQTLIISAAEISANAINLTRSQVETGNLENESQVLAALNFAAANMAGPGVVVRNSYPPVVSSGKNTTVLHYDENDRNFGNQHLLVDFGVCQYHYNSDVTRCFSSSSGNPNLAALHQAYTSLHKIQTTLIDAIKLAFNKEKSGKKDKLSLSDLNKLYHILLVKELVSLGFSKKAENLIQIVSKICPHNICHHIGLDVHDCKNVDQDLQLRTGMCFALEPGMYFREGLEGVPERFRNLGLRIEDVIVIGDDGEVIVASEGCEKDPEVVFG